MFAQTCKRNYDECARG